MAYTIRGANKYTASLLLAAVAAVSTPALAQIAQQPLSLTESVPPNMIFTLDDSGSMRWAFAPDNTPTCSVSGLSSNDQSKSCALPGGRLVTITRNSSSSCTATSPGWSNGTCSLSSGIGTAHWRSLARTGRMGKSSTLNPIYYDPEITYVAPKIVDTSGNEVQLSTSFTQAYNNGFNTARGNLDLSNGYKVSWTYDLSSSLPTSYGYSSTSPRLAENPIADFSCTVTGLSSNGSQSTCELSNGQTVTIRRGSSSSSCTATITGWEDGTCSRVGGSSSTTYQGSWEQKAVPAYYYVHNGDSSCGITDDSCYTLHFVPAGQQQNFANWYSFYRNRALATMSAASLAFFDLSSSVRLTWQGLGNCSTLNGGDNSNCKDNKFREFNAAHKGQFYAWLKEVSFNQSTYLPAAMKRAGEFFKAEPAWRKYPQLSAGENNPVYACRPSYHVAMTDGFWNETVSNPSGFRQDQGEFELPDGTPYGGQHPYHDTTERTLADLAMHYWATDLNPDVEDRIPAYVPFKSEDAATEYWDARNDPATWQHMVNYMMGLGLTEALNNPELPWAGGTFLGEGYAKLKAGTVNWPAASSGSSNNVYDLWHAAINSRGEFFSVDNPDAMVQAFKTILDRIAERSGSAASPAINSGILEEATDTLVSYAYHTYYYSDENWAGDLKGFTKTRQLNEDTGGYEVINDEVWSARSKLATRNWQQRDIKIAGADGTGLRAFEWDNAGDPDVVGTLAYMLRSDPDSVESPCDTATCAEQRLNFLRGDRSNEGSLFRTRQSVLGDMVSSRPVSVRGARYLVGYANSIEGADSGYQTFYEEQETRAQEKPRIYVGANDGMLHAFDATDGAETFAFVPTAVFPNLHRLTGITYNHHFYVDGSPVVADAYFDGAWRTVLIGTLRAGGKGLFALDITDPDDIKLLWEFDDSKIPAENGVRLGYSYPQPTVARLHNGKWAVVTGNGYHSDGHTHGKAALLIIDLETGELTKSIEVTGTAGVANGLSSPRLADMNVDGVADYAYAGDLQGNLWRFNLTPASEGETANPFARKATESSAAESHFKPSYGGKPLFKAVASTGERQPITAAPSIVRHPSRHGYLIIVGTGRYFEVPDKSGTVEKQSVYGIWDTNTRSTSGSESGPGGVTTGALARSKLQAQTYEAAGAVANSMRTLTRNPVKWAIPPTTEGGSWTDNDNHKYGWYIDLSLTGEMMIENMIQFGQSLLLQTLVPDDDPCASGAGSWTYGIDTQTGGRTRHHIFRDIRHPTNALTPVSAVKQVGEGGLTLGQRPDGAFEICTGENCLRVDPDPESIGRQSWRQVGD